MMMRLVLVVLVEGIRGPSLGIILRAMGMDMGMGILRGIWIGIWGWMKGFREVLSF
jgi:hypothetical protein